MTAVYELIQSVTWANNQRFRGRISVYERTAMGTYRPVFHDTSVIINDTSEEALKEAKHLTALWIKDNADKLVEIKSSYAA